MGKKILLLSKYDFGGSGYRLAEAIGLNSNNFVLPMTTHPYRFPKNIVRTPSIFKADKELGVKGWFEDIERMQSIINDVDIIHFKGDSVPVKDFINNVTIPEDKKIIVTVSGSFFRRGKNLNAQPIAGFEEYIKRSDVRTALTPDLNYPEFDSSFTQHAYPTYRFENIWKDSKIPTISHSPSDKNKKGTDIFKKACEIVKSEGIEFNIDIISGLSHLECLERKAKATVHFEQINEAGIYGNSFIESIAMGIPSITYISDEAIKQSDGKFNDMPEFNCGNTTEELSKKLIAMLTTSQKKFSNECYMWAKSFHSYKVVGKMWDEYYRKI